MFLWCVQEVAELKEEDIISHTATATQLLLVLVVASLEHSVSCCDEYCPCYYV